MFAETTWFPLLAGGTCRRGGKFAEGVGIPEAFDEARPLRYQPCADRFDRFRRHFSERANPRVCPDILPLHEENCTP
jgi:hypothetical protein